MGIVNVITERFLARCAVSQEGVIVGKRQTKKAQVRSVYAIGRKNSPPVFKPKYHPRK
jgi:hypothetical protein